MTRRFASSLPKELFAATFDHKRPSGASRLNAARPLSPVRQSRHSTMATVYWKALNMPTCGDALCVSEDPPHSLSSEAGPIRSFVRASMTAAMSASTGRSTTISLDSSRVCTAERITTVHSVAPACWTPMTARKPDGALRSQPGTSEGAARCLQGPAVTSGTGGGLTSGFAGADGRSVTGAAGTGESSGFAGGGNGTTATDNIGYRVA